MSLVLIGMMGVGKTTLGKAASKALGWRFIDVDKSIEDSTGRAISDIFAEDGEAAFRALESEALERLAGVRHAVVATGGGAPVQPGNFERMRRIGPVVYLEAGAESLIRRLKNSRTRRPMLGDDIDGRVPHLLAVRQEIYRTADFRIAVDSTSPMEVVLHLKKIAEEHS